MIKIPSRHAASHYLSIDKWIKLHTLGAFNNITNIAIPAYKSDKKFLFICGCGHSGTTLTAAKLGRLSSSLLIGRETNAFSHFNGLYSSRQIVREWDYFLETLNKSILIEKTPKHIHSIKRIKRILPHSKIIITTRNPLDNIASIYKRFNNIEGAIKRWLIDNEVVLELKNRSDIRIVKYEALTKNPEATFKFILEFLDEDWDPMILEEGSTGYDISNPKLNMQIRASQVSKKILYQEGKWKDVLNSSQANLIEKRTKKIANLLGYE